MHGSRRADRFPLLLREPEEILRIFDDLSGQRIDDLLTSALAELRWAALDFCGRVRAFLKSFPEKIDEYENLLTGNRIFITELRALACSAPKMPFLWA